MVPASEIIGRAWGALGVAETREGGRGRPSLRRKSPRRVARHLVTMRCQPLAPSASRAGVPEMGPSLFVQS